MALMKRDLAKQNHLASRVRLDHPEYHQDSNRADLVIDVRPGPIVKVHVGGAKLSPVPFLGDRQMKRLIPIFSEGTVDPDLVEEGRRNLVDVFHIYSMRIDTQAGMNDFRWKSSCAGMCTSSSTIPGLAQNTFAEFHEI